MSTQNRLASLLSLLSLVAISGTPSAQTWTQIQTSTRPPACKASAMVYDSARGVVVLFCMPKGVANAQTWEWNGSTWRQAVLALQPPAREFPAIAYDSLRQRVVLFGGLLDGLSYPIPPTSFLDDTWEYDGTSWQKMQPQHAPPGRMESMMTFDSGRGRCVLFGGGVYTGVVADTWEWDGLDWVQKAPVTQPPARASAPLVHDPV